MKHKMVSFKREQNIKNVSHHVFLLQMCFTFACKSISCNDFLKVLKRMVVLFKDFRFLRGSRLMLITISLLNFSGSSNVVSIFFLSLNINSPAGGIVIAYTVVKGPLPNQMRRTTVITWRAFHFIYCIPFKFPNS